MSARSLSISFASPEKTAEYARKIGAILRPGDVVLLEGSIGSGKTHFSRHLIQSKLAEPEDVPSPTFTLVQVYETPDGEIWHADLYRISGLDEIEELGLTEAFDTAICLVEWPEKLGPAAPPNALTLRFSTHPDQELTRDIQLEWTDKRWDQPLESFK